MPGYLCTIRNLFKRLTEIGAKIITNSHFLHFSLIPQTTVIGAFILTLVAFIYLFLKNKNKCVLKVLGMEHS